MLISVVNLSEWADESVQEVLRAINRQIAEDFAPYWHRTGTLRLEGAVGRQPNPDHPEELRGDAIIYLWDEIDQEAALGFHDLNYRGIPFSIVFTKLADELGENWSVTLSHEALELLVDPEVNLLVEGPHPDDSARRIHHWYEVCDAVQSQTYEIDGVAVSNFVLPLYFTESDESGSRNDFLGDERSPLPSFGVADGGYIGFYDPESGEHHQFVSPRGRRRLEARQRAGLTRRTVRRQVQGSPEAVLRKILGDRPSDPLPGPWFEGFALEVQGGRGDAFERLDAAARAALGEDWERGWVAWEPARARRSAGGRVPYELVPRQPVSPADAWQLAYALRDAPGVLDAEPEFVCFQPDPEAIAELPSTRRWAALFDERELPGSDDCEWSLAQIRAKQAWAHARGERISIAHPDTGYLAHPEIGPGAGAGPIDTARDYDFVADEDDARAEPQQDDLLPGGPGHGTSTASVIVSAEGPPGGGDERPFVSGVAPDAALVPLRVSNSVVHLSMRRLRKAIEYATDRGLHVVSMSLGGPFPSRSLRRAIREAREAGVILVAAAGNHIPFRAVVWPARYPEVVACAASAADGSPWSGTSRGGAVDITAPGESVWRAYVDTSRQGAGRFRVTRSSGTSYATANVAGVCALWLSRWGHRAVHERYGEHLADAFKLVLGNTAQRRPQLPAGEFGPGIVDALAVVQAPLPSVAQVRAQTGGARGRRAAAARVDARDAEAVIGSLLPHLPAAEVRRALEHLLGVGARDLPATLGEIGDELAFQIATDPSLRRQLSSHCRRSARLAAEARGRGARARRAAAFLDRLSYRDVRARIARGASPRLAGRLGAGGRAGP